MFDTRLADYRGKIPALQSLATEQKYASTLSGLTVSRNHNQLIVEQLPICIGDCGVFLVAGQSSGRQPKDGIRACKDSDEQASQILFGQPYKVLDISDDRKSIQIVVQSESNHPKAFWIESHKHRGVPKDVFKIVVEKRTAWPRLASPMTIIPTTGDPEGILKLPAGCVLPFYDDKTGTFAGEVFSYQLSNQIISPLLFRPERTKENLVQLLIGQLGTPYEWGGMGFGIDCSGLVKLIMDPFMGDKHQLAREAIDQRTFGINIKREPQTGDLLCYHNHVGILATGEDLIKFGYSSLKWDANALYAIHAKQRVRAEKLDKNGMTASMNPKNTFIELRRLLPFT